VQLTSMQFVHVKFLVWPPQRNKKTHPGVEQYLNSVGRQLTKDFKDISSTASKADEERDFCRSFILMVPLQVPEAPWQTTMKSESPELVIKIIIISVLNKQTAGLTV
jgi:hypothetical protein